MWKQAAPGFIGMLFVAVPAEAVELKTGDILAVRFGAGPDAVVRIDHLTGAATWITNSVDRTSECSVVGDPWPCCTGNGTGDGTPPCAVVGTGPSFDARGDIVVGPDVATPAARCAGMVMIYLSSERGAQPVNGLVRVDPATGDRTFVEVDNGNLSIEGLHLVGFPFNISALPSWGIAAVAGLLLGLAIKRVRG